MTLILIEGADCAGKSTLAGRVVDLLRRTYPGEHVEYRHCGSPTQHPLDEYVAPLLNYRPATGQHVVYDRHYVGELVYPSIVDRPSAMTSAVRTYVELFLVSRGATLVYCTATDRHLIDCGVARGDAVDDLINVPATVRAFDREVTRSTLARLTVDATPPPSSYLDDLASEVVDLAVGNDALTHDLNAFTTYVGPRRPGLLLVGDRRGTPSHDVAEFGDWPAFAPFASTSGRYLLDTLTSVDLRVATHGVQLSTIGLVNANDVDDVRALYDTLGRPSVVALGRNAQRRLADVDVPHRSAAHPQYSRRFLHHRRDAYLCQLLDVARSEAIA